MKVALVFPYFNEHDHSAEQVLNSYPLVRELPVELARLGHEVVVLHHAPFAAIIRRDDVTWRFVKTSAVGRAVGKRLYRWKGSHGPAYYAPALGLVRQLMSESPDVVHVFGMTMDIQLWLIVQLARFRRFAVVTHFHGGMPATGRLRHMQRASLRRVDRLLFAAPEQSEPWIAASMIPCTERVRQVMETSSPFQPVPRDRARAITGMHGDPVYLSAGRLDPIKDPLTTLAGFAAIADAQPGARLYLYFLGGVLLDEVVAEIARDPRLRGRVELRGRVGAAEMAAIYSSAEILIQSSLREWSGLAILEAMSCGCIPVVTRIPSFVAMTDSGRYGRLFAVGDAADLAANALSLDADARQQLAHDVQAHFVERLSFAAIARDIDAVYRELHPGHVDD